MSSNLIWIDDSLAPRPSHPSGVSMFPCSVTRSLSFMVVVRVSCPAVVVVFSFRIETV